MTWEMVIGLETHVELSTASKLFCPCATAFGGAMNTQCCPICSGLPGTLPALNERAVEYAVKAGLALGCEITRQSCFDRKHYFYPDLPKGYQIFQLALPIARNGAVTLPGGREIRIHELHLEEDAGKLTHHPGQGFTLCDDNRAGAPLIEVVTAPDFRSAEEVISYLELLRATLRYLEVSDCRMEEGSLRCDVNLSVRPLGSTAPGQRTEMKNLGSLKAIAKAIAYEARRQIALLEGGQPILPETRRWDEGAEVSHSMRTKESAGDYRPLPDPNLPPLALTEEFLAALYSSLPELPMARQARLISQYGLPPYDAQLITSQRALADFFEETAALGAPPKQCANWMMGEVLRTLSARGIEAKAMPLSPATLARLIALVEEGQLNRGSAVTVFEAVFDKNGDVDAYVEAHGLGQIHDGTLVAQAVEEALTRNPRSAADYQAGKEKALGFLVGQTMRLLSGKANPQAVTLALRARLDADE